ncbi:MAG: hypothetical protein AAGD14_09470 [Planctomycetota bacterium]
MTHARIALAALAFALLTPSAFAKPKDYGPPSVDIRLERITTVVPWPRGVRFVDGKLYAIGRGIHRSAGGPQNDIDDMAGHVFVIDPKISEPVVKGVPVSKAVRNNGRILARPTSPPFQLWSREMPSTRDTRAGRPYCQLVYDPVSRNFITCGFSGIDLPRPLIFRKNATDSVLRYDMRVGKWFVIDQHDPDVVPEKELGLTVPSRYYPHHDMTKNPAPHGMVNGPCGAAVAGRYLYVGAKDNTALVQYDLDPIRKNPNAKAPPARYIFHRASQDKNVFVNVKGHGNTYIEGTAAVEAHEGFLYVAFRTTSQIIRFPLQEDGDLVRPLQGELIAQFTRYDPKTKSGSANIYDMAFDKDGLIYVSPGYNGAVYRFKPDPKNILDAYKGYPKPYIDLTALIGVRRSGNICFDDEWNLYICSGKKEVEEGKLRGVIYRVRPR